MSAISKKYNVSLAKIIEEFDLEKVSMPIDPNSILIDENDVTRPGLQLMGFYEYFNHERIQVIETWNTLILKRYLKKKELLS